MDDGRLSPQLCYPSWVPAKLTIASIPNNISAPVLVPILPKYDGIICVLIYFGLLGAIEALCVIAMNDVVAHRVAHLPSFAFLARVSATFISERAQTVIAARLAALRLDDEKEVRGHRPPNRR